MEKDVFKFEDFLSGSKLDELKKMKSELLKEGLFNDDEINDNSDLDFDANFSSSLIAGTYKKVTIAAPSDADLNAVRTFQITGAPINGGYFPQFTKVAGSSILNPLEINDDSYNKLTRSLIIGSLSTDLTRSLSDLIIL